MRIAKCHGNWLATQFCRLPRRKENVEFADSPKNKCQEACICGSSGYLGGLGLLPAATHLRWHAALVLRVLLQPTGTKSALKYVELVFSRTEINHKTRADRRSRFRSQLFCV